MFSPRLPDIGSAIQLHLLHSAGPSTQPLAWPDAMPASMMSSMQFPHCLVPDWSAPPGVHVLCTTRVGGVSAAPFDAWNLGDHVGDAPAAVAQNRARLQGVINACSPGAQLAFLHQVHGTEVVEAGGGAQEADAVWSTTPGQVCAVLVADCLPVVFAHRSGAVVAAAHAGWRGLLGAQGRGVLESLWAHFWPQALKNPAESAINFEVAAEAVAPQTLVWLGPCIGPRAFEVGAEVRAAFCETDPAAEGCFLPASTGKYWADLPGLARQRLARLGLHAIYGNDGSDDWCTVHRDSQFFSHRRDAARFGSTGRMAVCIWRDGGAAA